jgi:hypothetical protein
MEGKERAYLCGQPCVQKAGNEKVKFRKGKDLRMGQECSKGGEESGGKSVCA